MTKTQTMSVSRDSSSTGWMRQYPAVNVGGSVDGLRPDEALAKGVANRLALPV